MELTIATTKTKQILDVTAEISRIVTGKDLKSGVCVLFLSHTTAALTTADLDPGTDLDMLRAFEKIIPKLNYRHPHNPAHVPSHILSSLIGTSLVVPINGGKLTLGIWQRIVLVELDGPKERQIEVTIINTGTEAQS